MHAERAQQTLKMRQWVCPIYEASQVDLRAERWQETAPSSTPPCAGVCRGRGPEQFPSTPPGFQCCEKSLMSEPGALTSPETRGAESTETSHLSATFCEMHMSHRFPGPEWLSAPWGSLPLFSLSGSPCLPTSSPSPLRLQQCPPTPVSQKCSQRQLKLNRGTFRNPSSFLL